jgi:lipopolysaccharide export system protein LptA
MRADCFARATVLIGLLCGGGLSGPPGAAAQGLSLSGVSEDRPIEVSADHGIEWQQDAQVYIARGNAMAKRGATEVHADTLTAHYRPSKGTGDKATGDKATGDKATGDKGTGEGGETEIYRLDADGHVTIKGERQTVVGDQAVYDVDQQIGIVTGKVLKMTTATDVVTARDSLEWYDQKQIAVARGDAVAVRDVKVIRADVLTAHMTKDKPQPAAGKPDKVVPAAAQAKPRNAAMPLGAADESSKISRVDAQGHVLVSTQTDVGRGDYGVYNADTGIATLLGNVTVTRGPNTVRGEYAVMDLNNNISRMMAAPGTPGAAPTRVEGLFVRQDQAAAPTGTSPTGTPAGGTPAGGAPRSSAPKP